MTTPLQPQKALSDVRVCWACRSEIHTEAKKCKECESFQGWLRWLGPANAVSILALLGTTVGIAVGLNQLRENRQAIESVSEEVRIIKEIDRIREELHSLGPNKARLAAALLSYPYTHFSNTSKEEAKLMMAYLKPLGMSNRGRGAVSGTFGDTRRANSSNFEVTVWAQSYEKGDTYGLRYGVEDGGYWGCNDTYFELVKLANGEVHFVEDPGYRAPCPPD